VKGFGKEGSHPVNIYVGISIKKVNCDVVCGMNFMVLNFRTKFLYKNTQNEQGPMATLVGTRPGSHRTLVTLRISVRNYVRESQRPTVPSNAQNFANKNELKPPSFTALLETAINNKPLIAFPASYLHHIDTSQIKKYYLFAAIFEISCRKRELYHKNG
jgi:hypothetical protein